MEGKGFLRDDVANTTSMPRAGMEEISQTSSMKTGFKRVPNGHVASHPLESSLKTNEDRMFNMRLDMFRKTQGIYAPLMRQMEMHIISKGMRRLPCLPSSNLSQEILMGTDTCIDPRDVFNDPTNAEVMGDPHLMMEKRLGI